MSNIAAFPVHQGKGLSQIKEYVMDGTFSDIERLKTFKATESEVEDDSGLVHNGNGDEDGEEKDEDLSARIAKYMSPNYQAEKEAEKSRKQVDNGATEEV